MDGATTTQALKELPLHEPLQTPRLVGHTQPFVGISPADPVQVIQNRLPQLHEPPCDLTRPGGFPLPVLTVENDPNPADRLEQVLLNLQGGFPPA